MNTLEYLGIYPDTIEEISEGVESALTDCGATVSEIDDMHESVQQKLYNGELNIKNLTNSIIHEYLTYAANYIKKKLPFVEVKTFTNCDDSHLYINGEDYFCGGVLLDSLITTYESIEISELAEISRKDFNDKGFPATYSLVINDCEAYDALIATAYSDKEKKYYDEVFEDDDGTLGIIMYVEGVAIHIAFYQEGLFFETSQDVDTKYIYNMIRTKLNEQNS